MRRSTCLVAAAARAAVVGARVAVVRVVGVVRARVAAAAGKEVRKADSVGEVDRG